MKNNHIQNMLRQFAVALVLMGIVATPAYGWTQQIHLQANAAVSSNIVRLGDIAQIIGGSLAEKSSLQKLELFPVDPQNASIKIGQVRDQLSLCGVDLLRWRLVGSNEVRVSIDPMSTSLLGQGALPLAERSLQQTSLRHRTFPSSPTVNNGTQRIATTPIVHPNQQLAQVAIRQAAFQDNSTGEMNEADQPKYAWTVKEDKARGVMISEFDLEMIELERATRDLIMDRKDIIGKVVRNRLVAGRPIRNNSLEDLKYVERGKPVRIVSKVDMISVSTTGRSLADATLGQDVTVESLDRSKKFIGTVTDFQTVTVSQTSSQESIVASHHNPDSGYRTATIGQGIPMPIGVNRPTSIRRHATNHSQLTTSGRPAIQSSRLPANSLR